LIRERLAKKCGGDSGGQKDQRQGEPLPAYKHVRTAGTVKDNFARLLDRTDSCPPSQESTCRQKGNEQDDDDFSAH
jgi:hypothetical protein